MSKFTHNPIAGMPQDKKDRHNAQKHPLVKGSHAQIDSWVESNVTDLESAKDAIKILAKAINSLIKKGK